MNKILNIIIALLLVAALAGNGSHSTADEPATGALTFPEYTGELSGRIVKAADGSIILIGSEYEAVILQGDMDLSGLGNGDWVTVYYDAMTRSIPPQANIVEAVLMQKGSIEDLPANDLERLAELGYELIG